MALWVVMYDRNEEWFNIESSRKEAYRFARDMGLTITEETHVRTCYGFMNFGNIINEDECLLVKCKNFNNGA